LQQHHFQKQQKKETPFNEALVLFTAIAAQFRVADGGVIISRRKMHHLQKEQCLMCH
jgi:hypothetical protein